MEPTKEELKEIGTEFDKHWDKNDHFYTSAKERQYAEIAFNKVYVKFIAIRKERDHALKACVNHGHTSGKFFDIARDGYRLLELLSNGTGDQEQWDMHTRIFLKKNKQAFEVKNAN